MSIPKREKKKLIAICLYNEMLLSNNQITDYIERDRNTHTVV